MIHLVVMAGGSGTRFWPKSTVRTPKQLLSFFQGAPTLLEQTIERFKGIADTVWILTTEALEPAVRALCPEANILAEPMQRNTAPCLYWAATELTKYDPTAIMLVMPSDHLIASVDQYLEVIQKAIQHAGVTGHLVTLGVYPTRPETGYGYIKRGDLHADGSFTVDRFVEKPQLDLAMHYIASKQYFWNAGMFIWTVRDIMNEFKKHTDFTKIQNVKQNYALFPSISVDYAILEKSDQVVMFPFSGGWDDLGSWTALDGLTTKDTQDTAVVAGEVITIDAKGNLVDAQDKLVALLGVSELIVSIHGDRVLVAHKDRAQDIKLITEQVKQKRPDLL